MDEFRQKAVEVGEGGRKEQGVWESEPKASLCRADVPSMGMYIIDHYRLCDLSASSHLSVRRFPATPLSPHSCAAASHVRRSHSSFLTVSSEYFLSSCLHHRRPSANSLFCFYGFCSQSLISYLRLISAEIPVAFLLIGHFSRANVSQLFFALLRLQHRSIGCS